MPRALVEKPEIDEFIGPLIKIWYDLDAEREAGRPISSAQISSYSDIIGEKDKLFLFDLVREVDAKYLKAAKEDREIT